MNRETSDFVAAGADCVDGVSLSGIQRGAVDALGNTILQVLWLGSDYAVYRVRDGVFVHFSDCPVKAADQRKAFMEISPELCELRFLTSQMRHKNIFFRVLVDPILTHLDPGRKDAMTDDVIYDHNIAEAFMMLMENNKKEAKQVARAALDMAIGRTINDNTIRYVKSSMTMAILVVSTISLSIFFFPSNNFEGGVILYLYACLFGAVGSLFSVMTRVSSFRMRPCQQSNMNYWMARLRIGLGVIGAYSLLLVARNYFSGQNAFAANLNDWQGASLIGLVGGFAERLVPTIFQRAADSMQEASGTPVQEVRRKAERAEHAEHKQRTEAI